MEQLQKDLERIVLGALEENRLTVALIEALAIHRVTLAQIVQAHEEEPWSFSGEDAARMARESLGRC